jgi:hypothetical protein
MVSRGIVGPVRAARCSPCERRPGKHVCGGQDDSGCPIHVAGVGDPLPVRRPLLGLVVLVTASLVHVPSGAADPLIAFSPNPAKTGANNPVSFTAPPGGTDYTWDLNGDGAFGDKLGQVVHWTYDLPGVISVGVMYTDASSTSQKVVEPLNVTGPPASFVTFPQKPVPGEQVTFAYSPGPALPVPPEWDLNGDGIFPDATGPSATRTFPTPGVYFVGLRVTDIDDAVSTAYQPVTIASPVSAGGKQGKSPPRLMSPFPVVRIAGKVGPRGALIRRLTVRAPVGSTVAIRCRGRGCPFRRKSQTLALAGAKAPSKTIRVKKLERRLLRGGASIKILVSRAGEIGKYTRFKIRTGKAPLRTDLCLAPGSTAPKECPSS